jgi:hypothetical protein
MAELVARLLRAAVWIASADLTAVRSRPPLMTTSSAAPLPGQAWKVTGAEGDAPLVLALRCSGFSRK